MIITVQVRVAIHDDHGREIADLSRTERESVDARGLTFWLNRAAAAATARVRDAADRIAGDAE